MPKPVFTGRIGVDAGAISVADMGWLRRQGMCEECSSCMGPDIPLKKGEYRVTLEIDGSHHGRQLRKTSVLRADKGFHVGDLCYLFDDPAWSDLMGRTDCLRRLDEDDARHCLTADTGGDGGFDTRVYVKRIGP